MINPLDRALQRLLQESGAEAALLWSLTSDAEPDRGAEKVVLSSCPLGLVPSGTSLPLNAQAAGEVERCEARIAAAVPAALRERLPAPPTAAATLAVDGTNLCLLLIWCGPPPDAGVMQRTRTRVAGEVSNLARVAADNRINQNEVGRLSALLDALDVGLVSVDSADDFAHVNQVAATLLSIPVGVTTSTKLAAAIGALAERALNLAEARWALGLLESDPLAELKTTWLFRDQPTHLGVVSKPAPYPWFAGRIWAFYDNSAIADAVDATARANALVRTNTDAMLDPQVLVEGIRSGGRIVDLVYRDVNRATCEYLRLNREELLGHSLMETLPNLDGSGLRAIYSNCADTGEPVVLDDFPYYNEVLDDLRYYDIRAAQAGRDFISLTWRDVTERSEWAHRISASEERFRLLAENMADVVVRLQDDGTITWISNSVEGALGAPPHFWIGRRAISFAVPDELDAVQARWAKIVGAGTHIGRARIVGADGTPHWIHMHSKAFYDATGNRSGIVASFRVIDTEVAAEESARVQLAQRDEQNRSLTRRLQAQTSRLMAELKSAARYVESTLPGDLDGPIHVCSRYVPSRELGGDSYDYRWIDDDHLIVYLVDVSGHGVEAAMVSVSVHNVLRSGTVPRDILIEPAAMLTELNRLFQMEQQGGNYFTAWYGVYQPSTRTLSYSCAGHPPALVFARQQAASPAAELATHAIPVGIFVDTEFRTETYTVPADAEIVLYGDGAYELTMQDGKPWSVTSFIDLCARKFESAQWGLDALIAELQAMSLSGLFEDDCTMVRLRIP